MSSTSSMVRVPVVRQFMALVGVVAILVALASPLAVQPQPAAAQRIDPNWSPPRTVYLPETGQSLDRLFL
ncbi:MAG: hypothetical protein ACRDJH_23465, partial [Thermomicrobiales bacterium]